MIMIIIMINHLVIMKTNFKGFSQNEYISNLYYDLVQFNLFQIEIYKQNKVFC